MPTYLIRKIYQYTDEVNVEANSSSEAKNLAQYAEGDRIYDDHLYDCEVISVSYEEEDQQ